MKTKKITALILSSCLLFSCSAVFASNDVDVIVKDSLLVSSQNAFLKNNTTYVPMRSIFEKLGAQVSWDKNTNVVTATKDGKKVEIKKPYIVKGSTMVPLRYVSEALGSQVNWEQATQTAYIDSKIPEFSTEKYVGAYSTLSYRSNTSSVRQSIFIQEFGDKFLIIKKYQFDTTTDYTAFIAERAGRGLKIDYANQKTTGYIYLDKNGMSILRGDAAILEKMIEVCPEIDLDKYTHVYENDYPPYSPSPYEFTTKDFFTLKTDNILNVTKICSREDGVKNKEYSDEKGEKYTRVY